MTDKVTCIVAPAASTSEIEMALPVAEENTSGTSSTAFLRGRHAVQRRIVHRCDGDREAVTIGEFN